MINLVLSNHKEHSDLDYNSCQHINFVSSLTWHTGKRRYLILKTGCMYYYKDESASSAQGQFSLEGYR